MVVVFRRLLCGQFWRYWCFGISIRVLWCWFGVGFVFLGSCGYCARFFLIFVLERFRRRILEEKLVFCLGEIGFFQASEVRGISVWVCVLQRGWDFGDGGDFRVLLLVGRVKLYGVSVRGVYDFFIRAQFRIFFMKGEYVGLVDRLLLRKLIYRNVFLSIGGVLVRIYCVVECILCCLVVLGMCQYYFWLF